ncbi:hypothetical protein N3K66_002006 [Trichothecium roseum]|uniref:Uncharacterized protein n=1 Tax=Trichothecium roseum TaxID=47278 RepID=A0ACC0V8V9_9HYPO|nr:hypothetical protein N3K66_002006 [Trichothecium roseum]
MWGESSPVLDQKRTLLLPARFPHRNLSFENIVGFFDSLGVCPKLKGYLQSKFFRPTEENRQILQAALPKAVELGKLEQRIERRKRTSSGPSSDIHLQQLLEDRDELVEELKEAMPSSLFDTSSESESVSSSSSSSFEDFGDQDEEVVENLPHGEAATAGGIAQRPPQAPNGRRPGGSGLRRGGFPPMLEMIMPFIGLHTDGTPIKSHRILNPKPSQPPKQEEVEDDYGGTAPHIPDWFDIFLASNVIDFSVEDRTMKFYELLFFIDKLQEQIADRAARGDGEPSPESSWDKNWHEPRSYWPTPKRQSEGG